MAADGNRIIKFFSSFKLSVVLLMLLGLLTWFGTLEQAEHGLYEVQKKYFESYVLMHDVGPISIPLPGANLVMTMLFLNLVVGGLWRIRKGARQAGVLVVHVGILLLLVSGFIKLNHSEDGHVTLYENGTANTFQSYHRWELAISRTMPDGGVEEWLIPQEDFLELPEGETRTLFADSIPFELELSHVMPNAQRMPKGPMFDVDVPVIDGQFLQRQERVPDAERNTAGVYVALRSEGEGDGEELLLWGRDFGPTTHLVEGMPWQLQLRKERYPMPFSIALDDFLKEDHPGTSMPSWFSSDVTVVEGGSARTVRISMNEPLRSDGLVLYQASWGPANAPPGTPLFSTLAVVRNPADQYPLYACILIAIGLLLHFSRSLTRYVRSEARS